MGGLHRGRYLAAAEASRAHINPARGTIDNGRYALDVRFPCPVCASVGVADTDPERNALVADLTLSHLLHLLALIFVHAFVNDNRTRICEQLYHINRIGIKMQAPIAFIFFILHKGRSGVFGKRHKSLANRP